jgi:hypothetical protein
VSLLNRCDTLRNPPAQASVFPLTGWAASLFPEVQDGRSRCSRRRARRIAFLCFRRFSVPLETK